MISNAVAYVTGGGRGLGRATCKMFAENGIKVIVADISKEYVDKVVAEIGSHSAMGAVVDVSNEAQVAASMDEAVARFGKVSINVNCAGIAPGMKTLGKKGPHSLEQFSKTLTVNTIGTFNVLRLAASKMALNEPDKNGCRGVIINTASIAAMEGQIGQAAYAASKGAVVSMTLPIARDLASFGIRVCTIAPGLFMTPMMEGLPEQVKNDLAQTVPFPKRLGMMMFT
jgi:NAD(P)-dependent dehydrogenase (short-subunit alcohol dehydrogenase family)